MLVSLTFLKKVILEKTYFLKKFKIIFRNRRFRKIICERSKADFKSAFDLDPTPTHELNVEDIYFF